ncbi:P2X purinoceptor 3-like isoform X1 [Conger conger]|uniref:P2X purinoceptor 3-like isoform X1 n=1 Tax=Conger conger TaxID=82655 RepID=UPI002A5AC6DC|nr:P2X purinoceptor 3-like isoform X1 [Conger conger]
MIGCVRDFFTYETTKSVVVKSSTIGIFNRVVQLLIIAYFVGWVFLHEKAYQVRDTSIESTVITKVKGLGLHNNRIMDVADYVTPPQGASMFCIITKLINTEEQIQSSCAESEVKKARCANNSDCREGETAPNGIMTGRCVDFDNSSKTCEIQGWCPAEIDSIKIDPMMEVQNFTIFIKNSIRFPLFNFTKGTLLPSISKDKIKTCFFNMSDIYCPIFRVADILRFANQDFDSIANEGGVIGIKINWVCDLDRSAEECNPAFSFTRLDAVSQNNNVSTGYNFRFAKYYKSENGTDYRTLIKAFAIRFDIIVSGTARKFSVIPTLINVVAAFTTVGVGTVLCDIILLNFLKGGDKYKAVKFEEITDSLSNSNELYQGSSTQLSVQQLGKLSEDSGAYSNGQQG